MAIKVSRPHFPKGYVSEPPGMLSWEDICQRMDEAQNYWIATVGPNGAPHVTPVWGAWVKDRFYFDGDPATRHLRNIAQNPQVAVHLESGSRVLVINGHCEAVQAANAPTARIAEVYRRKYADLGYKPKADQWDAGGLFVVIPKTVIAWTEFSTDPTKFTIS